jgi:shikimate kinase
MKWFDKHIILIGFKHVGKSTIGKALALSLKRPFVDLDHKIELLFKTQSQQELSCREIMQMHGEAFFRNLESKALDYIMDSTPSVISLGGGAALTEENQPLIQSHCVVYIKAPKDVVFQRILASGQPAFFDSSKDLCKTFDALWDRRENVYERLANFSVNNEGTVESVVEEILNKF